MKNKNIRIRRVTLTAILLCHPVLSLAQSQPGVNGWIDQQIDLILDQQTVGQNGQGSDRQKESPSADARSTSLVDQTSATDFFSVAANIIPVTPGLSQFVSTTGATAGNGAAGSTTATASLFALLAALNKVSPTDPKFYAEHVLSRRFSFTVGTAASTLAIDNTDTPATVYGAKALLINSRELYTKANLARLKVVQDANANAAKASAALKLQITELIFAALNPTSVDTAGRPSDQNSFADFIRDHLATDAEFQATLNSLSNETRKRIQNLIESSIAAFSQERAVLQEKYDEISKAQQLSISYTANIRDAKGNNNHRIELIFDYGLSPRINWTVNASGDYTDRKSALDSKGGRVATSFIGNLTQPGSAWAKNPITLTFSGEGRWQTSQKPQYTFEAKLTIPLVPGVELPLAYRYANRIAQINQTASEARMGLSVDISRLAHGLK
jgi:hypothetical protein